MPKRRSIPISFKKQVIAYVTERKCSVHAAYMHFKRQGFDYDEACYYRWYFPGCTRKLKIYKPMVLWIYHTKDDKISALICE